MLLLCCKYTLSRQKWNARNVQCNHNLLTVTVNGCMPLPCGHSC